MEKADLKITLIRFAPEWEHKAVNLDYCNKILAGIQETDLIVLSEMFTTGFTMNVKNLAESMDGPTVQWMQEKAGETGAAIAGSTIIEENGNYYNRFLWITPAG